MSGDPQVWNSPDGDWEAIEALCRPLLEAAKATGTHRVGGAASSISLVIHVLLDTAFDDYEHEPDDITMGLAMAMANLLALTFHAPNRRDAKALLGDIQAGALHLWGLTQAAAARKPGETVQ